MNNLIVLNGNDNVGVSQFIIPEKTKIEGHDISTLDPIPFGHKVCLKEIKNCLLYTSPSPRDATLSRMPSSA